MFSASRSEVSSVTSKVSQIAIVDADDVGAGSEGRVEFVAVVDFDQRRHPVLRGQLRGNRAFRVRSRMAAISRIASAPCAAASTIWKSSMVKSLRRTGMDGGAGGFEIRQAALEKSRSVRTEIAAAPPASYARAMRAGSKSARERLCWATLS